MPVLMVVRNREPGYGSVSNAPLSSSYLITVIVMFTFISLRFSTHGTKHFQDVMLVGMASEIRKKYTYKCANHSRHNGVKGAKAKCAY